MFKKIVSIVTVIVLVTVSTIAVSMFATPAAKASYTEKPEAQATQVNDELDVAGDGNTVETVIESSNIVADEVESETVTANEEQDAPAADNTAKDATAQSDTNKGKSGSTSKKVAQATPVQEKESQAKFTPVQSKTAPVSSTPVKLSQADPYYYTSVLSAAEKAIYDTLLEGINSMSDQITLGQDISKAQIENAFRALVADQSQLVWLGSKYTIRTTESKGVKTMSFLPTYTLNANQAATAKSKLDSAVNNVLAILNGKMTQLDIEVAVHDYLIKKVDYSNAATKNPNSYPMAYTAYGALVDGSAVCEGYSKAFQLVLGKVGIQTTLAIGKNAGSGHMWNMANIDGSWYHVDTTFDDPNNGVSNAVLKTYLNLSTAQIGKTHTITSSDLPSATKTTNNYFAAYELSFDSYNSTAANKLYSEILRAVEAKETVAQIRVGGKMSTALNVLTTSSNENSLSSIKAAAQKELGKNFSQFAYSTDADFGVITVYLAN